MSIWRSSSSAATVDCQLRRSGRCADDAVSESSCESAADTRVGWVSRMARIADLPACAVSEA
jgi:hypothetical protein